MQRASFYAILLGCSLWAASCSAPRDSYREVKVAAPFPMEPIREYIYPQRDFLISDYGAQPDGLTENTSAVAAAIAACHEAGGGRVVVPRGTWLTGPVHLKSNVNLHLQEGAVLRFVDRPEAYLPAVPTSWEGMECYNYSPLVYAYECQNVAITGKGKLEPQMDLWRTWFPRPAAHMEALKQLYTMASTDVPVVRRQMAVGENHLRPHLIQFNRCQYVLLDGFEINGSPFWTIHLYLCDGAIARGLKVYAHGHNNDGIDLEMSCNILVENCTFDQGDDAVVIKSGRNRDAWRLNTPAENIVVRRCTIVNGHTLLGIGSEMSGGVRNVYMHDCRLTNDVFRLFFLKTNHRRGGFIENITLENVKCRKALRMMEIDTEVLYQWKNLVPTYETRITRIGNIAMRHVECDTTKAIYELKGDARLPIRSVELEDVHARVVTDFVKSATNVEELQEKNVTYGELLKKEE